MQPCDSCAIASGPGISGLEWAILLGLSLAILALWVMKRRARQKAKEEILRAYRPQRQARGDEFWEKRMAADPFWDAPSASRRPAFQGQQPDPYSPGLAMQPMHMGYDAPAPVDSDHRQHYHAPDPTPAADCGPSYDGGSSGGGVD